jgi:hypothetical protein
MLNQFYEKSLL